jgi:hypothetical protein
MKIKFCSKTTMISSTLYSAPYTINYSCASQYNTDGSRNYCSGSACYAITYCNTNDCNKPFQNQISTVTKCNVGTSTSYVSSSCTTSCVTTSYSSTTSNLPYLVTYSCSQNITAGNFVYSCNSNNICVSITYCNTNNCNFVLNSINSSSKIYLMRPFLVKLLFVIYFCL